MLALLPRKCPSLTQRHEPYFIKVNQSIFEQEEYFVNSFLLKPHAEKLQFVLERSATVPDDLWNNPLQMGSFHVRPPSSVFNFGLNYSVHHPFRTTHTDTPCQRCTIERCVWLTRRCSTKCRSSKIWWNTSAQLLRAFTNKETRKHAQDTRPKQRDPMLCCFTVFARTC